jgi:murein DD-endopeptidase MepM/ murein hydrolase activator NlpD
MAGNPERQVIPAALTRRGVLAAGAAFAASAGRAFAEASSADAGAPFAHSGRLMQGGVLIGLTDPGAPIAVDGKAQGVASPAGLFVVGFDRDAPAAATVAVYRGGAWREASFAIAPVSYDIQKIDGLPQQMVTATDPAVIAREKADNLLKAKAFASRAQIDDFQGGFVLPLDHPVKTSPFGVQRVLNGEPKAPHYGVDLAAPIGTPIHAPAPGLVVLAEPDLYLDGGLTLIDHGQGLISMYLHQSRLDVKAGDRVAQLQPIGAVGMKGRATGPHLCWRMKWRDRNLDPSLMIGSAAPSA